MAVPGKAWYHITIGTLNSWLPGDPRGWRSRGHKRHSSGHHRNSPPPGEHAGLHRYSQKISGEPIIIPRHLRPVVGRAIRDHLAKLGHRLLTISVGGMHVHLHVELPIDQVKKEIGRVKRVASMAVRSSMPGRVWARDCGVEPIESRAHQRNTHGYIHGHHAEGAWVWTYRNGELPYEC